jgi:hypothetical protein
MNKSPLESRGQRQARIQNFDSPSATNKMEYNAQSHSNKKGAYMDGHLHGHQTQLLPHSSFGPSKQQSPMKKLGGQWLRQPVPQDMRTPVKGRCHSPDQQHGHVYTSHKDEALPAAEQDASFSSNTTRKYKTKTSKGSVIHSNFKLNPNSI